MMCWIGWTVAAFLLGGVLGLALCCFRRGEQREIDRAELIRRLEDLRKRTDEGFEELLKWLRGS